jgi:hypothetical protein
MVIKKISVLIQMPPTKKTHKTRTPINFSLGDNIFRSGITKMIYLPIGLPT